jgi:hypothetical protein
MEETSIRKAFEERFGAEEAEKIWAAATEHGNGINDGNLGDDPFKWAILIAIGYQCVEKYANHHGITIPFEDFKEWVRENADLASHTGDCDYLALACGVYRDFVKEAVPSPGSQDEE